MVMEVVGRNIDGNRCVLHVGHNEAPYTLCAHMRVCDLYKKPTYGLPHIIYNSFSNRFLRLYCSNRALTCYYNMYHNIDNNCDTKRQTDYSYCSVIMRRGKHFNRTKKKKRRFLL